MRDKKGRKKDSMPFIPVKFVGPGGQFKADAILDSGADTIIIPKALAADLGIELRRMDNKIQHVGGASDAYEGYVFFELGDGPRRRAYGETMVRVVENTPVLIGRKPVFEDYKIEFCQSEDRITLAPNGTK